MRILHLIPQLSGGGTERQLSLLAPEMARAGHEVHVAYIREGPEPVAMSRVTLHRIGVLTNHDPRIYFRILTLILRLEPDIIQTWIVMMDIIVGLLPSKFRKLWVLREPSESLFYINPTLKMRLRTLLAKRATAIVSNSMGGRIYWCEQGIPEECLFTKTNAVPSEIICGIKPEERCWSAQETLICAGRLVSSKNVDIIIKVLFELIRCKELVLLVAGDGPEKCELIRLADSMGIGQKIKFLGNVQSHDLWACIKAANAFISLSACEGTPNCVCEAAACGTPMILSDIPAHRAFFDEGSAFFVSVDSVKQIADTICHVLEHKEEAKLRAGNALDAVKFRKPDLVASEYLDLYKKLLDGNRVP